MTAKSNDYADLWGRVMDKQERRRQVAARDRALEIVEAQRARDYDAYISDRDTLVMMYGDRDTRVAKSPVKLYDADHPRMPEPAKPSHKRSGFSEGLLVGICVVMFVAFMGVATGVLFMF